MVDDHLDLIVENGVIFHFETGVVELGESRPIEGFGATAIVLEYLERGLAGLPVYEFEQKVALASAELLQR